MAVDGGARRTDRRTARGAGWWVRTVLMLALPVAVGLVAGRRAGSAQVGLAVGVLALVGSVFTFHPDTLGWRLSLHWLWSAGPDAGPSHAWRVWARLSGLLLLVVCLAGALLWSPPPPPRNACSVGTDGTLICVAPQDPPQDAPAGG